MAGKLVLDLGLGLMTYVALLTSLAAAAAFG